ncbi:MAG TPA: PD-(D/E)XK nuclease family protein, partial [Terriglobales bacterium]|nr:PD-(D/E)XK nuclease family protein [Terriglobales bacterium]
AVLPPPLSGICGDAARCCRAWLNWRAANPDLKPAHTELMIYSRRYQFAGTTDALFLSGGKLVLFDWKTGAKLHGVYRLQVAAYAFALREMGAGRVTLARVVRLCRRTVQIEERAYSARQLRQAFTRFLKLRKATA